MSLWRATHGDRYTCKHLPRRDASVKQANSFRIDLERFLPYRLSVLTNVVSGAIASVYQQRFGLTIPEWRVIAVLVRHPGLSAAEVATHTRMDAVAVSRAVSRLLRCGRIRRSMSASDRRRSVLQVSPDGETMYREIAPLALRYEQDLLDGLRGPELAVLDSVLDKLMTRAQTLASAAQRDAVIQRHDPRKRSAATRAKKA